jgi:hypothetical protein
MLAQLMDTGGRSGMLPSLQNPNQPFLNPNLQFLNPNLQQYQVVEPAPEPVRERIRVALRARPLTKQSEVFAWLIDPVA